MAKAPKEIFAIVGPEGVIKVRTRRKDGLRALRQVKFEAKVDRGSNKFILSHYVLQGNQTPAATGESSTPCV